MAEVVLGIGSSHTPLIHLPGERWAEYAEHDRDNLQLVFPPDGVAMSFTEAMDGFVTQETKDRYHPETFLEQHHSIQLAMDRLRAAYAVAKPDVAVIISDDQEEFFFDDNMPSLSVYWGDSMPLIPANPPPSMPAVLAECRKGYGDVALDVPVDAALGRHIVESVMEQDFDVAQFTQFTESHGGTVTVREKALGGGEHAVTRTTAPTIQGLPHGFGFVVKQIMNNDPIAIVPIFQNTCFPPNHVRPHRAYDFGVAIGKAIDSYDKDLKVAVIASGGLSHMVTDEVIDRSILDLLQKKDEDGLRGLPRERLRGSNSESLNWVAVGGVLSKSDLEAELVDYVPVYRTEAGTGGGWGFMLWR